MEDPLQKLIATALSAQQKQQQQQEESESVVVNGGGVSSTAGRQSSRTSSSSQNGTTTSTTNINTSSPKRQAATAAAAVLKEAANDSGTDPPPIKRSPGRPPGSPNKVTSTRPSILCVTHQMSHKKRNYSVGRTVPYEMMNYKWYLMELGQHMTILAGTWSV